MHKLENQRPDGEEAERIRSIYADRDRQGWHSRYAWHRPVANYQSMVRQRMFARAINASLGADLSGLRVLDVGCGTGVFLRQLVEWGASPNLLMGTEYLADRLERARQISPTTIDWRHGSLDFLAKETFDLVSSHTVFSSILDETSRRELAMSMWDNVKPGGWVMVFDFRYNNPSNPNVRKVTRQELESYWSAQEHMFFLDMLAPPLARLLVAKNYLIAELMTLMLPLLRSHFVFMARK